MVVSIVGVRTTGELQEYAGKNGGGTGEGEGDGDDAEEGGDHVTRNARLTLMLEDELPNCHNQERVDEFAVSTFPDVYSKEMKERERGTQQWLAVLNSIQ